MSVAGIGISSFFDPSITQSFQNKKLQFQKELQQLSQDLQAGNLSASQVDFAALQKLGGVSSPTASSSPAATAFSANPLTADLNQLGQDLKSGNIAGAQQDLTKLQQDSQGSTQGAQTHHHHHHSGGGAGVASVLGPVLSPIIDHLDPVTQAGGLTAAQQAYSTFQGALQQFAQSNGVSGQPDISSLLSGVSLNA